MDEKESWPENEYDVAGLVTEAFIKIYRMGLVRNEFCCMGMHPLNGNVFNDIEFYALKTDGNFQTFRRQN
jgi:hypothetical protein